MIRKFLYRAIPYRAGKAHSPAPHSGSFFLADSWALRALTPARVRIVGFIDKVQAVLSELFDNQFCDESIQATVHGTEAGVTI